MSEVAGYVLRIASGNWLDHVFEMAIYYTNLERKWGQDQIILFTHKTNSGDCIVGYGVIDHISQVDELCEEDKNLCKTKGWKKAIEFKYVKRFKQPLLVKSTFLGQSKLRGRYLHGLRLDNSQLKSILSEAE